MSYFGTEQYEKAKELYDKNRKLFEQCRNSKIYGANVAILDILVTISFLNKSIQKHNNLMGCQPYAKHRFRQKSERCFCISSGHRDQKGPAHFPRFVHGGSAGCIPRRRATHSTAGAACQGQSRRCAAVLRTLDRLSRLCYLPRRDGGYILQSRPLSLDRERAGG